jgi:hypothetical protein
VTPLFISLLRTKQKRTMHAGQVAAYTQYPQLDGENEITEMVCRDYPHPKRVAIEELSSEDKDILESVSLYGAEGGDDCLHGLRAEADYCLRPRASTPKQIIQGSRARLPERRGKTRRYAAIFDEKGLPLPSATGVMIGGPRSSMLADGEEESEREPIVVAYAVTSGKSTGFRAALRRRLSSAARSVFTCCPS